MCYGYIPSVYVLLRNFACLFVLCGESKNDSRDSIESHSSLQRVQRVHFIFLQLDQIDSHAGFRNSHII